MNREFYAKKAYQDSVTKANATNEPLEIWPSEQRFVSIEDLPFVRNAKGYLAVFEVRSNDELRARVQVGKKYGMIAILDGPRYVVGEWE
jgi:hypothetical protein